MKKIAALTVLMIFATIAFSQTSPSPAPAPENIKTEWNDMLDESENYQNYKVIKKSSLNEIWRSIQDSIKDVNAALVKERAQIAQQKNQIAQLQTQLKEVQAKLETVSQAKDNMQFMGVQVDKYSYATALWVIIGIVVLGAAVLFFLFKNSNKVTVQKKNEYEHLFNRFEEYKKNKIEMERKLKRELQTHINTLEEMKSRQSRM